MKSPTQQQGITLYLAVITLSAALATALFIGGSLTREYKISTGLINSVKAVYVADSVTEYTLYQVRSAPYTVTVSDASITITLPDSSTKTFSCPVVAGTLDCATSIVSSSLVPVLSTSNCSSLLGIPDSSCSIQGQIISLGSVSGCPLNSTGPNCIYLKANGSYGGTNRAMEIVYENK